MPKKSKSSTPNGDSNQVRPQGHLGFEGTLWVSADKLRDNLDGASTFGQKAIAPRGAGQNERWRVHF